MNRIESSIVRSRSFAFVLILAVFLAWRSITLGMADLNVAVDPDAAIGWRSADASAQYNAAQADFLAHRYDGASVHAQSSIASYPLDGRSYRVLAAIAEAAGSNARAKELFALAERRAPRDLPTRIKLAGYALKEGDIARAVHEADMLLRMQPELNGKILPGLVRLSGAPEAVDPIAIALSNAPTWRIACLSMLSTQSLPRRTVDRIFARISSKGSLSPVEIELQHAIRQRAQNQALVPAVRPDSATAMQDWFDLMEWKGISSNAYRETEDPFDTIGMP